MSAPPPAAAKTLGQLKKGERARISAVTERVFLEMGLLEGSTVEVIHEAPFGGDPIAVRVRGAIIALRRNEADQIAIEPEPAPGLRGEGECP